MKYLILFLGFTLLFLGTLSGQDKVSTANISAIPYYSDSIFIAKIHLDCNHKTVDRIIFRELLVKEKQKVCRRNLDSLLERESSKLMNTKLFILAEVIPYHLKGDTTELIVSVIEKWYLYPFPIIDFADRSYNEWASKGYDLDRLIYGVRLVQNNFRGRNETLKFYMQLGFVRIGEFEYKIPYINKNQTIGLNFRVAYSNSKNSFYVKNGVRQNYTSEKVLEEKFVASLGITKRSKFYSIHKLNLNYITGKITDSLALLNPIYYLNARTKQQYFQLHYTFEKENRDNIAYPLQGQFLQIDLAQSGLTSLDDIYVFRSQINYAKFVPLSKKLFYAGSWRAMLTFPAKQPLSEMRGYGFNGNFTRGMELNQIPGQHFAVWKNTLKWKMFSTIFNLKKLFKVEQFNTFPLAIYPKIYADAGYVYSNYDYGANLFSNQTLWGAGAGIDLVFYNSTVLRLEYSPNAYNGTSFFINIQNDF
jgi:outer membrane protein assembly factor BamA